MGSILGRDSPHSSDDPYKFISFPDSADLLRANDVGYDRVDSDEKSSGEAFNGLGPEENHRTFTEVFDVLLERIGKAFFFASRYAAVHNPTTKSGRKQIKATVTRSGLGYRPTGLSETEQSLEKKYTGWRLGVLLSAAALLLCFIAELIMLVAAVAIDMTNDGARTGVLFIGKCGAAKRYSTLLSIPINIIATCLIAISNYIMQCLSSPTEKELRFAHKNGWVLQLGVPTPMNSYHLGNGRKFLWFAMALTSVPVHLLLNSAFFTTLQANDYGLMVVTSDYNQTAMWHSCGTPNATVMNGLPWTNMSCGMAAGALAANPSWERLDNDACMKRYSDRLIDQYSNLILVSNLSSTDRGNRSSVRPKSHWSNNLGFTLHTGHEFESQLLDLHALLGVFTSLDYKEWQNAYVNHTWHKNGTSPQPKFDPSIWMCNSNHTSACTQRAALTNVTKWVLTPEAIPIDHCLSQAVDHNACKLEYSIFILIAIMICDIVKILVAILLLLNCMGDEEPIVTLGDALAVFLKEPETCTRGRCLKSSKDAFEDESAVIHDRRMYDRPLGKSSCLEEFIPEAFAPRQKEWRQQKHRLYDAVTGRRWLMFIFTMILLAGTSVYFLQLSLRTSEASNIWLGGFRTADPSATFLGTQSSGILGQTVLVNLPQLLFSFLYLTYNGMFTVMHAAEEWAGFAIHRKSLRVSNPQQGQRSTYWLNLPWSYSLPLLVLSILIHFLVSRSLYLVRIDTLGSLPGDQVLEKEKWSISACGFSPLAMFLVLIILVIMVGFLAFYSLIRLDAPIPLVGMASTAVSAACHHPNDCKTEAVLSLMWGVTKRPENGEPGHCSLSSEPVEPPEEGAVYS